MTATPALVPAPRPSPRPPGRRRGAETSREADLPVVVAATRPVADVLADLRVDPDQGLSPARAADLLRQIGPNAVTSHRPRPLLVLARQLRSPLLGLLVVAAVVSFFLAERSDALVIGAIIALSVGLGFANEYRAETAAAALHDQIRRRSRVLRGGRRVEVETTELVPGDLVALGLGDIVPADLRLTRTTDLSCDESIVTGESVPAGKQTAPVPPGSTVNGLASCALMGTVVSGGAGTGVVVATAARTTFGQIAASLAGRQFDTEFQVGLRRFSLLLMRVAGVLTGSIFVVNLVLGRPLLDSLLFSLAIAVGITPQLLPAVVSTSLAAGSRQLRRRKVLVKRLVCVEDLGDVDLLFTDKTGTLTEGTVAFTRAVAAPGVDESSLLRWGLLCTTGEGQQSTQALDAALASSPAAGASAPYLARWQRIQTLPFDHERRLVSVLVDDGTAAPELVTKGAPEAVLERCTMVPDAVRRQLDEALGAGDRVIAVATRPRPGRSPLRPADERDLVLAGLLVFADPPKAGAAAAIARLRALDVGVKVITGDHPAVATTVAAQLGLGTGATLTGADLDRLDDDQLTAAIPGTLVFARVSPAQKARIVRLRRRAGQGVAFLGDGVNDAPALHAADVGISVDSAADVAQDAADVLLLEKSLDVLADGVTEGRRIFANTMKYVLMGTSSNFGNMFSAAAASLVLPFLPMLPSQILLNNLLYDLGQLAIPTDHVDPAQLRRPSHWDLAFIRRAMLVFGPLSSLFDVTTFAGMLWYFHADPTQFRTGWFLESLVTQTLVVFAIRTRLVPFLRSRPSRALTATAFGALGLGIVLATSPLAPLLGFAPLPYAFFAALLVLAVVYLVLVDVAKRVFYAPQPSRPTKPRYHHRLRRRASHFSTGAA